MKRLVILLVLALAMGWVPLGAQATETIFKTPDGLELSVGLQQKNPFFTLSGLDLTKSVPTCQNATNRDKDCNFRSITVPDTALGRNQLAVWNFSNLLVNLEKGPVAIHVNLEVEASLDAAAVDVNNINLERAVAIYKTGLIGDLFFGMDVHLFDPEGGLVYQDEDPGIWVIGRDGPIGWNLGFHKRFSGVRGGSLFTGSGATGTGIVRDTDLDQNIIEGRVDIDVPVNGIKLTVSPLILVNFRHTPQSGNLFACPTGTCGPFIDPDFDTASGGRATIFYPGTVISAKAGPLALTAELVGMLGKINELGPAFTNFYGRSDLNVRTFAVFAEAALDLSKQGIGLTPFVNVDYRRGDRDPRNKTLGGYVDISDLTTALRKDGFNKQSISSLGPQPLGAGGEAAWGFNTSARGIGPSLGTILADEGVSVPCTAAGCSNTFYNNRWGKGDNPGLIKLTAGALGKINRWWDAKAAVSYFRFDTTKPIKQEACANIDHRVLTGGPFAAGCDEPGTPRAESLPDISKNMGVEFNANVGWSPVAAIRFQPFISVFVPLDAVSDINGLLLDSHNKGSRYMAGVEFKASF